LNFEKNLNLYQIYGFYFCTLKKILAAGAAYQFSLIRFFGRNNRRCGSPINPNRGNGQLKTAKNRYNSEISIFREFAGKFESQLFRNCLTGARLTLAGARNGHLPRILGYLTITQRLPVCSIIFNSGKTAQQHFRKI
jgi:hypothetical protein